MASYVHIRTVSPRTVIPLSTPISKPSKHPNSTTITVPLNSSQSGCRTLSPFNSVERGRFATLSMTAGNARELDVLPVHSEDCTDQQDGAMTMRIDRESEETELMGQKMVGGFEGRLSLDGLVGATDSGTMVGLSGGNSGGGGGGKREDGEDLDKLIDRAINAAIVLGVGSFAVTKLLTVDSDYWHGWTVYEILRYAPQHNWSAYEEALKTNPVLAKMVISGIVYSLGDWIAQCVEGKPLFEFDRARMMRSGFVGFSLHGSLSHYYYEFCESLFPFHDWWVVPAKVVIDQTVWTAVWNSIYYMVVGMLRFESPLSVFGELRATFWPMLTAGWKLWPFAHLVTYGLVPLQQRLLWVDCVELIWVTILSTFSNEKSQARIAETSTETNLTSSTTTLPREPEV